MTDKTTTTTIPAGWKLVPIEPTPEMKDAGAGIDQDDEDDDPIGCASARLEAAQTYRAMIAAAPAAPSPAPAAPSAAQGWRYFNDDRVRLPDGSFGIVTGRGRDGLLRIRPEAKPDWSIGDLTSASDDDLDAWRGTPDPLEFGYTNWRGEYARRRVQPIRTFFGSTEWHPEPQWLLEAVDLDKGEVRAFAVRDMAFCAQPNVGPNVAVQDVAEQVEQRVNERGGEAAVDDIVALTIEVLWEMQRAQPAQGGCVSETANSLIMQPEHWARAIDIPLYIPLDHREAIRASASEVIKVALDTAAARSRSTTEVEECAGVADRFAAQAADDFEAAAARDIAAGIRALRAAGEEANG